MAGVEEEDEGGFILLGYFSDVALYFFFFCTLLHKDVSFYFDSMLHILIFCVAIVMFRMLYLVETFLFKR